MRRFTALFLLMSIYCSQAVAGVEGPKFLTDEHYCDSILHPGEKVLVPSSSGSPTLPKSTIYPLLTLEQAEEIVGAYSIEDGPRGLLKKAIHYLLNTPQQSVAQATDNLEILLVAVQKISTAFYSEWLFKKFPGVDGSFGFSGTAGHALLITTSGELFKGMIFVTTFRGASPFVWNADYGPLTALGRIKIVAVKKAKKRRS